MGDVVQFDLQKLRHTYCLDEEAVDKVIAFHSTTNSGNGKLSQQQRSSLRTIIRNVADSLGVEPQTIKQIVKDHFEIERISQLRPKQYEPVVRYLIEDLLVNSKKFLN